MLTKVNILGYYDYNIIDAKASINKCYSQPCLRRISAQVIEMLLATLLATNKCAGEQMLYGFPLREVIFFANLFRFNKSVFLLIILSQNYIIYL